MKYHGVVPARFVRRENRFVALCEMGGVYVRVHVPNTGRCEEILSEGAAVYLLPASEGAVRTTGWTLVSAEKSGVMFNLDSQMPNRVFREAVEGGAIALPQIGCVKCLRGEVAYEDSRLDFFLEGETGSAFCEVKGVTLLKGETAMFPDAPTQRGIKHLNALCRAKKAGYSAFAVFVLQFSGARVFTANREMHPEFSEALAAAKAAGVEPLAFECDVYADSICLKRAVSVEI